MQVLLFFADWITLFLQQASVSVQQSGYILLSKEGERGAFPVAAFFGLKPSRQEKSMASQNSETASTNIIESMNQAFNNQSFYGMEYVLDELVVKMPPAPQSLNRVDWFGFWDFLD